MLDAQPNGTSYYRFWQRGGGFDRNIHDDSALAAEIEYMHMNPVRRKLYEKPSEWKWSSATDHELLRAGPITLDVGSLPRILQLERKV